MIYMILGVLLSLIAVPAGYASRRSSHAIMPWNNIQFIALLVAEFVIWLLLPKIAILPETVTIVAYVAVDVGYIIGYAVGNGGDILYLDLPDDDGGASHIGPFVYYYHDGAMYHMPQTLGAIIKSALGARHPLDMPIHEVSRSRSVTASNGLITIQTMSVIPVSKHEVEDYQIGIGKRSDKLIKNKDKEIIERIPRWWFKTVVTSHTIRFANTVTDDYHTFWTENDVYKMATAAAVDAQMQTARLEVLMKSSVFDAGADLVSGMVNLGIDSLDSQSEILERIERERKRRGESQ